MSKTEKLKRGAFIVYLLALFGTIAWAGTTDNMGLNSAWTTVSGWFNDGYLMKIVSVLLLIFAISLAIMKQYLYGLLVLIMDVIISNLNSVVSKFASATF